MCHLFYWFPFFMGGFGWIWMIIGLILIIGLIILFVRKVNFSCMMHDSQHNHDLYDDEPIKILKRMYAKGEISEEEYEKRRKKLEN